MDDRTEQLTVTDDGVEIQRTIDDQPTATVVVYRLSTLASAPSVVQLEEAVPQRDRIETLEFHPEHRPNDWTEGDGTVQFDVVVPPNGTRMVVLGLEADDDAPLGQGGPKVSHLDRDVDDLREFNGSAHITRGGSTSTTDEGGTTDEDGPNARDHDGDATADGGHTGADSDSDEVLDLPDPNADEEDTSAEDDSDEVLDLPDPNEDEPTTLGNEVEQSPEVDGDTEGQSEETGAGPSNEDDVDSAEATGDGDDDVTDDAGFDDVEDLELDDTAEDSGFDDDVEDPEIDDTTGDSGFDHDAEDPELDDESGAGAAASADGQSLVSDLLADVRAGHASEEDLDALRSELGVARADEVRFRHVQSRMSDFEAYVDALEGIINTHGTAAEFVEGIEAEVTDLEDELGEIRAEVDTVEKGLETADDDREQLADEVADLDETVTELADEVAEVHDLVETVDERTTTLETELRAEIEDLRDERADQLDDVESELDAVKAQLEADFEAEFDSLREDVESFNELRRTLLDAFGTGLDVDPEDDAAGGDGA